MRKQFRASNGHVMHMQTAKGFLGLHCPGADRLELTVDDIDHLADALQQARLELIQRNRGRTP